THVWHMKRVEQTAPLDDPQTGQSRQYRGLSMLIPTDWTWTAGSLQGDPATDCAFNYGRISARVVSADHKSQLLISHGQATFWSSNRSALQQRAAFSQQWKLAPCTIEQPKTIAQVFETLVPHLMKNGHAVGQLEPVPGLSEELPKAVEKANQQLGRSGSHLEAEAGRLRIAGDLADGSPGEAWLIALETHRFDPAPGGGSVEITDIPMFVMMVAPAGKLDSQEKMYSAMLDSVQIAPEWTENWAVFGTKLMSIVHGAQNRVAQIQMQMAQDNANAAAQQAQIRNGTQQYRNKVYSSVANNRAAALDHSSQQFALHMGDQAIYSDPATGQRVQMSNQYGHAWASTTGNTNEYILTDSPSYDPNGHAGSGSWTQMQQEH
ncbi:MAG: hypothetical protein ABI076_04320, partial [Acidobacteriaceae bacterium]